MEEDELKNIWKDDAPSADAYYHKIEAEIMEKAQRQSHDLFERVRKNINLELITSFVLGIGLPIVLYTNNVIYWVFIGLLVVILGITLKIYLDYLKNIRSISGDDVLHAMERKIGILRSFVRRVTLYYYVFGPIGFYLGFSMSLLEDGGTMDTMRWIKLIAFSVPFLVAFLWLCHKYVYAMYTKHLKRLQEIYAGLQAEV